MEPNPKADAWWSLKARLAAHGPAAGLPLPSYCAAPVVLTGIDFAEPGTDRSFETVIRHDGMHGTRPTIWFIDEMLGLGVADGPTDDAGPRRPID